MHRPEIGAAVRIDERDRDAYFPAKRGIARLEFVNFNEFLVLNEFLEAAALRVGSRGRLAGAGRSLVSE
jgi:hypothetical protein